MLYRKGIWLTDGSGIDRRCSKCGYTGVTTDDNGNLIPDKYCPNCGRKMKTPILKLWDTGVYADQDGLLYRYDDTIKFYKPTGEKVSE